MNAKIVKIDAEYTKNAAKIAELQERQKELEKQRLGLENTDIIGIARENGLTPDALAELIRMMKDKPSPQTFRAFDRTEDTHEDE